MLQVLCDEELLESVQTMLFDESTTIGVRYYPVGRRSLKRRIERIETSVGTLRFKICSRPAGETAYPEYDDIRIACLDTGKSYQEVYETARREAQQKIAGINKGVHS